MYYEMYLMKDEIEWPFPTACIEMVMSQKF